MTTGPHDTPITEGSVGSVDEFAPAWHFGPVPDNIVNTGADRNDRFSGTPPPMEKPISAQSDPHDAPAKRDPGEWRVPANE